MFWWLAQNTLLAGVLALGAALAGRFGRLSPAVRHALWLLVLVKLVTPPVAFYTLPEGGAWSEWLLPLAAREKPRKANRSAASQSNRAFAAIVDSQQVAPDGATAETVAVPPTGPAERPVIDLGEFEVAAAPKRREAGVPIALDSRQPHDAAMRAIDADSLQTRPLSLLHSALVGVWAIGAGGMVVLQAVRLVRFRRLLRNTEQAPCLLTALVEEIAAWLRVSPPRVVLTSAACSPMIFGFGRPRLIWPQTLAEPLAGDALRAVIAHELAHLRRRDHWVGWLELVASCGWWWNPLFWYVRRQLRETAELACDAWVVALLPGGRRAYAQALIDVSEMISWTAAPAPAVGMGASARHLFERRLTMILRERVPCRAPLVGLAIIGLLAIAVLPGWTKGQAPVAHSPPKSVARQRPATGKQAHKVPTLGRIALEGEMPAIDERRVDYQQQPRTAIAGQLTDRYARQPVENQHRPQPAFVIDLPYSHNRKEVQIGLAENQQIRVRSAENQKIGEMNVEHAENMRIVTTSPQEIVLMAVRPGKAVATLSGDDGSRLIIHADILTAEWPASTDKNATPWGKLGYVASVNHGGLTAGDVETLTRARYKLPPGRAEALAAFIKEHVKVEVETRVDADTLVVTAPSEDQAKIGQFVQLLKTTPEVREAPEELRDTSDGLNRSSNDPFSVPASTEKNPTSPAIGAPLPATPESNSPTLSPPETDSPAPSLDSF